MKITTTIDIPEETVLEAKYILLAHRNASERRLLSSFYRACLLAGNEKRCGYLEHLLPGG